jgi:branched-chain amino acid transport system substrate-binding protein
MKTTVLALSLLLTAPALAAGYGYAEKPEPPPAKEEDDGCVSEPADPAPPSGEARPAEDEYPFYGNTPEDMIPYRGTEPYYRYWTTRLPFRGPGQDYPDPPNLKSLKVGLLSPAAYGPEGARGKRSRQGVLLAFEEANATRKPGQLPFEIIEKEDAPQWGSAANITVDFKDADVLGFLGTIDGDATHVALRAALKIETYMVNTSDPDPTLTETQIPWLTRVWPDDRQQCFRLANLIVKRRGCQRIAVLRESSRPGRVGVMHFNNYIRRLGYPPVQHLFFKPGDRDISAQIEAIKAAEPDAVLFYGQPEDVGRFVRMLREAGLKAQFFGFDRLQEGGFRQHAGEHAEGMTITYFFNLNRTDPPWLDFAARYEKRWGQKPDVYAAYGYDGAKLMIEAIDHAGPNRFRIRDHLASLNEWDGVTGHMIFDGRWDNIVPITTARFKDGEWHYDTPPPLNRNVKPAQTAQAGVAGP